MSEATEQADVQVKSPGELKKEADKITVRRTLYAAGAGLLSFWIIDAALLLGIQITMVRSISNVYGVAFKGNLVKSIIGSQVGSAIGGLTAATVGAAPTYALGKVFTQHFDQGGTLLNFDPVVSREYFQQKFEAGGLVVKEAEYAVGSDKSRFFSRLSDSKRKEHAQREREDMVASNKSLTEAIVGLREDIAGELIVRKERLAKINPLAIAQLAIRHQCQCVITFFSELSKNFNEFFF